MSHQPDHSHLHMGPKEDGSSNYLRLDDMQFDPVELLVLEVTRHFIMGFHHPESQAWIDAIFIAEDRLGQPYGAMIASNVLKVVNAVRAVRSTGFNYCNPHCVECAQFITKEERYLIAALHNLRRDQRSEAYTQAMLLCQGGDDSRTIKAMRHLALSICDPRQASTEAMS